MNIKFTFHVAASRVLFLHLKTWHIQNPGIFRTLTYSKSNSYSESRQNIYDKAFCENRTAWKLSKYGKVSKSGVFSPYSVRMLENTDQKNLRIWTLFTHVVNGYSYFRKFLSFLQCELAAFSTWWNKYHEVITIAVAIVSEKPWCARLPGTVNFWYTYWCIQIN